MPVFEIQGPDGRTYEIEAPDPATAASAWQKTLGAPAPSTTPDSYGGAPAAAFRGAMDAVTFGMRDELAAAVPAALGKVKDWATGEGPGFQARYAENLAAQRAADESDRQAHPWARMGGQVAGGVAGGLAAAPLLPSVKAAQAGAGLGAQALRAAGEGAVSGAAYGFGSGEGAEGRAANMAPGAVTGAALGAVAPFAAHGVEAASNALRSGAVPGVNRSATQSVLRSTRADNLLDEAAYAAQREALGPQATLADMGRNTLRQADAVASLPGPGKTLLLDRAGARAAQAGQRVEQAAGAALGPAGTMTAERDLAQAAQDALGDAYEAARQYGAPLDIKPVTEWVDEAVNVNRGAVQAKLREVKALLASPKGQMSAEVAHNARMALDDMANRLSSMTDPSSAGKNAARAVTEARRRLDSVMKNNIPGLQEADATFAGIMRQRDALEEGLNVFSGGAKSTLRPDELAKWLAEQPPEVADAFRRGAVNAIDAAMGTARNDALAVRRMFQQGWNQEKLALIVGPDRARDLTRTLDAETVFAGTKAKFEGGADTAARLAAQREFTPSTGVGAPGTTVADIAVRTARAVQRALSGMANDRKAAYVADMLSRSGADRDALVAELRRIAQTQTMPASTRRAIIGATRGATAGAAGAMQEWRNAP